MNDQAPIVDQHAIEELRASVGGDDAFVADLASTYVAEGNAHVAQIEAAAASGDLDAIVRPAHSMKSGSASLGAARMAQLSREIELAGREGRREAINELVGDARMTWDETVAELRARGLVP